MFILQFVPLFEVIFGQELRKLLPCFHNWVICKYNLPWGFIAACYDLAFCSSFEQKLPRQISSFPNKTESWILKLELFEAQRNYLAIFAEWQEMKNENKIVTLCVLHLAPQIAISPNGTGEETSNILIADKGIMISEYLVFQLSSVCVITGNR